MQDTSTMFAKYDIMEKEKCRLKTLFSSMTDDEKKDVLLHAQKLLKSRKG